VAPFRKKEDTMPNDTKSKAQAVRDYLATHSKASAKEVVDALAEQDITINAAYVYKVKAKSPKPKSASSSKSKSKAKPASSKQWKFPKNTLEDAIRIPKSIEEKNAGNPMRATDLTKAVGFKQANDWRFLDLLRSANQYGLVSGTGKTALVRMEKLGQDIIVPASPRQRQMALLAAFNNVSDFKAVADFYGDKKIPEDEFFLNTLAREFKIPRDRVDVFSQIFLANLEYLRAFAVGSKKMVTVESSESNVEDDVATEKVVVERTIAQQPRVREFLDTCFVMMPFGDWFDKYYQEIYVPAIREAGFEPIRADELFSTGSVVEQIWEQVQKAKVLFADLTGRNANVFYELGLAHAARKPVVFAAPQVEDVPFDLRHLRVIIYEVREPDWSTKLRISVTDYLKNAIKDPEKSIPHPFRGELED
jgi:hypothetical protein